MATTLLVHLDLSVNMAAGLVTVQLVSEVIVAFEFKAYRV